MQLNTLSPNARAKKKRIGRGGKFGTTATRGTKGAGARSGGAKGANFSGDKTPLFRRTPKLRGFKSLYAKKTPVTLDQLEKAFTKGEKVNLKSLTKKGLVNSVAGAKILSVGKISKALILEDCPISAGAAEKIKAAGGEVKMINSPR